MKGPYCKR